LPTGSGENTGQNFGTWVGTLFKLGTKTSFFHRNWHKAKPQLLKARIFIFRLFLVWHKFG